MTSATPAPNHHADHTGFAGPVGLFAGLTMIVGRGPDARLAAETVHLNSGDRVIDVGCGPGSAARLAARRGAAVTGVDPAPVMLALARRVTRPARPIRWCLGSAESLPCPDHSATVVWSLATVHHWRDIDAGLAEAKRVLAPQGRLVVIERRTAAGASGLASHGWTSAQADAFAEQCRSTGFQDVNVIRSDHGRRHRLLVRATAA